MGSVLEALEDMKVRFISLNPPLDTGQPLGRGTAHVIMAVSEWERNRRADITSAARAKGSGVPDDLAGAQAAHRADAGVPA